jgi:hypothetical protein
VFAFIVDHKLSVVKVILSLMRGIWSKVLGFRIIILQKHIIFMQFFGFLLVGPVTLKNRWGLRFRFFCRTTKPIWFLKLCLDDVLLSPTSVAAGVIDSMCNWLEMVARDLYTLVGSLIIESHIYVSLYFFYYEDKNLDPLLDKTRREWR